jgi:Tfp pilus assembly protein PilV
MKVNNHRCRESGVTLAEVLISVMLLVVFFASIFEVNAVCLRYINASKENVGALQGVHDRIERLRSLAFTDLTSQSYMTTLLTTPADSSAFAITPTEIVVLTDYATGTPTATYTRSPGASSTPTVTWSPSGTSSFPSTTSIVKATVTYNWNTTFANRSRTEQTETIISTGVKK